VTGQWAPRTADEQFDLMAPWVRAVVAAAGRIGQRRRLRRPSKQEPELATATEEDC
jgi:hypothetical protein